MYSRFPDEPSKTKPMKHIIILAIGLALTMPLQAGKKHAGAREKQKPNAVKVFKKKDADKDRFLSKEEFAGKAKNNKRVDKIFAKKDKDSDGKLSLSEFTGKKAKANKNKKAAKKGKANKTNKAKAGKKAAKKKK